MSNCYKKPFLNKVITRIDFTAFYDITEKGLPKKTSDEILKIFPIPEPRSVNVKQVDFIGGNTQEKNTQQNHLYFYGKNREKTLCITPNFMFIEYLTYDTYDNLKEEFQKIVNVLNNFQEFSANRFGLRYINQITLSEDNPLTWDKYLNKNLLTGFSIPKDKKRISRVFSNLAQQYEDGMILNFQYGMHNPDFPSQIKNKTFILDYDAYYQGKIDVDEVIKYIDTAHDEIESLYEDSITKSLRTKMEIVNG